MKSQEPKLEISHFYPDNGQDWCLELRRTVWPEHLNPSYRPLLIVPGYGMNNFIFSYHPDGLSMEAFLARQGFEVWSVNLRAQGGAKCLGEKKRFGFYELALVDLPCAINAVLRLTKTGASRVDAIGCSMGASLLFAYLARYPDSHRLGSLVSVGGPLRWETVHPALKFAFSSPQVAGTIPFIGARQIAGVLFPLLGRYLPKSLSIYMNTDIVNLEKANELVKTVEPPVPYINRQIAHWIREKDLKVGGVNVTRALSKVSLPTLCVVANRDGIVTPESARSVAAALGTRDVTFLEVGNEELWFAHADLFVSRYSQEQVFSPLAAWLISKQG